ncbi:CsgE family curli-type amyloid fiber assembly protein [Ulvibacter antarcticus]|nr:CsgE family curli-type amyloid fiber assembly protein [Ulvibacter antarcticus]
MNNEFIEVKGSAFNRSEINQSLRYVLSVIRQDPLTKDKVKKDQTGRFVLAANTKINLSESTINSEDPARIIILLLIFDTDDSILGKDRIVLNDDPTRNDPDAIELQTFIDQSDKGFTDATSRDVNSDAEDGVVLRGIVVEETKTKPGSDFYKIFYQSYRENEINSNRIITIKEVFALGRNTKLEVKIEGETVFEFFLRPKEDYLKEMNRYAMRYVFNYLKKQGQVVKRY